jgi:hypothetical protein
VVRRVAGTDFNPLIPRSQFSWNGFCTESANSFSERTMEPLKITSADVLFVLLGAIMILAMHAGFAFLELGTVRKKNQVNALVKIMVDFAVSTIAYFFIGYGIAYGVNFFAGAETLAQKTATTW